MDLEQMIETGSANPLVLFGLALLLGALHGLEPGHSKTMMAAYIIAVQGTVRQAVLLGVSAAISHSLIVWVIAIVALTWGNALIGEELEPWLMILSGLLVLGIAASMLWRVVGPRLREGWHHDHDHDGASWHDHDHDHHHGHGSADAHARAHAEEVRARMTSGRTGTWQTILFGLTGGLVPCPAAITVFLLCLHLGKVTLGLTLVGAFSLGLAGTLVAVGVVAALGLRYAASRSTGFDGLMMAAPWLSAALIALIGLLILSSGFSHLAQGH